MCGNILRGTATQQVLSTCYVAGTVLGISMLSHDIGSHDSNLMTQEIGT